MGDVRAYYKNDVGYFDNPKIEPLVEFHPRAVLLHQRAIAYCAQHLTDGKFPPRLVMRKVFIEPCGPHCGSECEGQCALKVLVQYGLISVRDSEHAIVHDYLEHNRSAAEVKKAKAAGQKGAAARWGQKSTDADRNATPNGQRERKREITNTSDKSDDRFPEFYDAYPRKEGRGQAVKAWKAALKKTDADTILAGLTAQQPLLAQTERRFVKLPATWLNGECWADEIATPATDDPYAHLPAPKRYGHE